jgi:transposase
MMSRQPRPQPKLFYTDFNLDQRVRPNHPLRKIAQSIDFDFTCDEVGHLYGTNGNPSVPPPVILKLMLLLVFYNVRSERELVNTLPERMDWLWFLGFDLDTPIPNHSVLSKARRRWGVEVFRSFFERIVWQCVEAGLVDSNKLFVDASIVEADASMESLIEAGSIQHRLHHAYPEFERRLEEQELSDRPSFKKVNRHRVSTTDPDAAAARDGKAKLAYKVHRAVEGENEIITDTQTTAGDTHESHVLETLLDGHEANTGESADTVVADAQYGTIENLLKCHERGVRAHMPHLGQAAQKRNAARGVFAEECFRYDVTRDVLICPAGQELRPHTYDRRLQSIRYTTSKGTCKACPLRPQCTKSKAGREVRRHRRQQELDQKRAEGQSPVGRRDVRTRQHLMERSFARGTRYGFDRARWRGLWRMQIQELLTCAVQNIQVLVNKARQRPAPQVHRMGSGNQGLSAAFRRFHCLLRQLAAAPLVLRCQQPANRLSLFPRLPERQRLPLWESLKQKRFEQQPGSCLTVALLREAHESVGGQKPAAKSPPLASLCARSGDGLQTIVSGGFEFRIDGRVRASCALLAKSPRDNNNCQSAWASREGSVGGGASQGQQ